jgi:phospholipid/cholesterol/gamma-HCH transport system ATP-binding protein
MIRVEAVSKRYRDNVVLDRVDLEIPDGATTVILGPSGVGKTVLLKIMAGLVRPDEGRVFHDDRRIHFGLLADNRRLTGGLGYVFQGGALFDSLTVAENVALVLEETTSLSRAEARIRVDDVLRRVGMADSAGLYPRALSGGMTRLVAIARALVADPRCVFFDEPTTGLDPILADMINELILKVNASPEITSIVITHDMVSAYKISDKIAVLFEGRIIETGSPDEIRNTRSAIVRQFIEGKAEGPIQTR